MALIWVGTGILHARSTRKRTQESVSKYPETQTAERKPNAWEFDNLLKLQKESRMRYK